MLKYNNASIIQGPHCLADIKVKNNQVISENLALEVVEALVKALDMKKLGESRIVKNDSMSKLSIYQIIATSHVIIHFTEGRIYADLFSCEPFDVNKSVSVLEDNFGKDAVIQYSQRNLTKAPQKIRAIPMKRMNKLTSNSKTFTHAMINWYGGDESLLRDTKHGSQVLESTLDLLCENENLPNSEVLLIGVDPVKDSWDKGGFSGGYINLMRQITLHTFAGVNGAFTDIMAHTFDMEKIIQILKEGFKFKFFEVDCILQRMDAL